VRPQAGSTWAPKGRPVRHRATYRRKHGVRYFFAAYDVHADELWMEPKARKRSVEVLDFLAAIRAHYPDARRIYLVMDNLSTHKTVEVMRYCRANRITPVFTATNASWMNRIECHFAPFKKFVISNSDYSNHEEIQEAARDYLKWRNADKKNNKILKAQKSMRVL
jgi:transposase